MPSHKLPQSIAIIGAGAAALFAARRLRQLGVREITLIEKERQVGGKCSTYFDPHNSTLKAERGAAVIAPNYGVVIDALLEKGIKTERTLSVKSDTLEILKQFDRTTFFQRMALSSQLSGEMWRFARLVRSYQKARAHLKPLPSSLETPFASFAKKHRLENISLILKPIVTGFGYGDIHDCPAYSVLEYVGYLTIPFLIAQHFEFRSCQLRSIQGGFQSLMQKVAEDFQVLTSTNILQVIRNGSGITLNYQDKKGAPGSLKAEALLLAVSPKHWEKLIGRENLTPEELACTDQLTYYRYPVVICKLKGLSPHYFYQPEILNKDKFGHVAFVSTSDKRENPPDGRLCSAYINQLPHHSHESNLDDGGPEREQIIADLHRLPGVTGVEIIECKIWEDYFSSLPWQVRIDLEKQQYAPSTKTIYAGSYALGSFEDVACVANRAVQVIDHCFHHPVSHWKSISSDFRRFFQIASEKMSND